MRDYDTNIDQRYLFFIKELKKKEKKRCNQQISHLGERGRERESCKATQHHFLNFYSLEGGAHHTANSVTCHYSLYIIYISYRNGGGPKSLQNLHANHILIFHFIAMTFFFLFLFFTFSSFIESS